MKLAITGATGFVGKRLLAAAGHAGHAVTALTRRAREDTAGVRWITGTLEHADALNRLVEGADAVIHVAGVVNAPDRARFAAGNVEGTRRILAASEAAGVGRFVHVSTLAAREPGLSIYGETKAAAEALVTASATDWDIVRPPAVYGPGDMDMYEIFRLARHGLALLPPAGRMSAIHVDDLARLLLALAAAPATRALYEPDDGQMGGWSHTEFARAVGTAVGRRVLAIATPAVVMRAGAWVDRRVRGDRARLTPDRVAYFCHPDWVSDPARRAPPTLWTPRIATPQGLADTAAWYRAQRLL